MLIFMEGYSNQTLKIVYVIFNFMKKMCCTCFFHENLYITPSSTIRTHIDCNTTKWMKVLCSFFTNNITMFT